MRVSKMRYGLLNGMTFKRGAWALAALALVALVLTGCRSEASSTPKAGDMGDAGLDEVGRLALGILQLEDTDNAVTSEQAGAMLPFWQLLQSGALISDAETASVVKSIEGVLTADQLAVVSAVDASSEGLAAWMETQAMQSPEPGADQSGAWSGRPQGMAPPEGVAPLDGAVDEDRAAMRERMQSMTPEERETAMAERGFQPQAGAGGRSGGAGVQMGQEGATPEAMSLSGGSSYQLVASVIRLLSQRSGQAAPGGGWPGPGGAGEGGAAPGGVEVGGEPVLVAPEGEASPESKAAATPTPTPTAPPEAEAATVNAVAASVSVEPALSAAPAPGVAAEVLPVAQVSASEPQEAPQPAVVQALTPIPDTDPGPPLTVAITTNTAVPNPDLEGGTIYHVAGYVSNPTDEVYAVTAVNVTFYDAAGFRGAFYPFTGRGARGGEWIWHGDIDANIDCPLLAPGGVCPFSVQIAAQNMASFLVHPDAVIAEWHEPAAVDVSVLQVVSEVGYTRIGGAVANPNAFAVKNVVINGVLLDSAGRMVGMGAESVVKAIPAGTSAQFEVRIAGTAYVTYELHAYAEGDFK